MTRRRRTATAVIGAGRLASCLAPLLARSGYRITAIAARRRSAAAALAGRLRGAAATTSPRRAAGDAELLLLAVSDRAIATVARQLARAPRLGWSGRVVLHHAGALGLEPLAPLAARGAGVGVLHPLQTLGDADVVRRVLAGSRARVEGCPAGLAVARRVARDLGLVPLRVESHPDARVAYHAAAALGSNDVLALLSLGVELLESIGIERDEALAALGALARGTLLQAEAAGLDAARTGPVARGDVEVVQAHLRSLARRSARHAAVHRLLSQRLLALSDAAGSRLPRALRGRLARLLGGGVRGPRV